MSRHIRRRFAKLVQESEEAPEVVIVFAPWAVSQLPAARETPPASPAPPPPEPPSGEPDSRCPTCGAQRQRSSTDTEESQ
jgi:hypothetical protein